MFFQASRNQWDESGLEGYLSSDEDRGSPPEVSSRLQRRLERKRLRKTPYSGRKRQENPRDERRNQESDRRKNQEIGVWIGFAHCPRQRERGEGEKRKITGLQRTGFTIKNGGKITIRGPSDAWWSSPERARCEGGEADAKGKGAGAPRQSELEKSDCSSSSGIPRFCEAASGPQRSQDESSLQESIPTLYGGGTGISVSPYDRYSVCPDDDSSSWKVNGDSISLGEPLQTLSEELTSNIQMPGASGLREIAQENFTADVGSGFRGTPLSECGDPRGEVPPSPLGEPQEFLLEEKGDREASSEFDFEELIINDFRDTDLNSFRSDRLGCPMCGMYEESQCTCGVLEDLRIKESLL